MLTLAIDTATATVGVAVGRDGVVLAEVVVDAARRHAEALAPAIEAAVEQAGVVLRELDFLSVGVGPGLFTGLRVGVTTARTIAQVLAVPVVGVPSLDLLAHPWCAEGRVIVALIDARRREVYVARYRGTAAGLERTSAYAVEPPDEVAAELAARGESVLLVGDGARAYADAFAAVDQLAVPGAADAAPSAAALVELATVQFARGEHQRPDQVQPLYLRQSDAEINWAAR